MKIGIITISSSRQTVERRLPSDSSSVVVPVVVVLVLAIDGLQSRQDKTV